MRRLTVLLSLIAALIAFAAPAKSDLGGTVPSPGNCDYPAIGVWGLDGPGVYHWVCDLPTEVNGSHHHCQYGGAATNLTLGVSFMFVNASIQTPTGILLGACWYACPDLSVSDWPNPVGAWKTYLVPRKCVPIGPNPLLPPAVPPAPQAGDPGYVFQPPAANLNPALPNPDNIAPPGQ